MSRPSWQTMMPLLQPLDGLARILHASRQLLGLRLGRETVLSFPADSLSPLLKEAALGALAELEGLGFRQSQRLLLKSASDGSLDRDVIELQHEGEPLRIQIHFHTEAALSGRVYCMVLSTHADGTELVSTEHRNGEALAPAGLLRIYHDPDTTPLLILQRHRQRLADLTAAGNPARALNPEQSVSRCQECMDATFGEMKVSNALRETSDGHWRFRAGPAFRRAVVLVREEKAREEQERLLGSSLLPPPISSAAMLSFDLAAYRRIQTLHTNRFSSATRWTLLFGGFVVLAMALGWQPSFQGIALLLLILGFHEACRAGGRWLFTEKQTGSTESPEAESPDGKPPARFASATRQLGALFMGPLPMLFLGMAGLAWIESPGPGLQTLLFEAIAFNLFCLLPLPLLDGGAALELSFGARFPRWQVISQVLCGLTLVLIALLLPRGLPVLLLAPFLFIELPCRWRRAELLRVLREKLPENASEEAALGLLLPALRRAPWKTTSWPSRLAQAPELLRSLRLPAATRNTRLLAILGITSPLWLGLGSYLAIGNLLACLNLANAHERAAQAGLSTQSAPTAHTRSETSQNGASILSELRPELERLCAEHKQARLLRPASTPQDQELRIHFLESFRKASLAPTFHMSSVKEKLRFPEAETLLKDLPRLVFLPEAKARLKSREPDEAFRLAVDLLRMSNRFKQDKDWWPWTCAQVMQEQALHIVEEALSDGALASNAQYAELLGLLDEASFVDYSITTLAPSAYAELLHNEELKKQGLDPETLAAQRPILRAILFVERLRPSTRQELIRQVEECIDNQERMRRIPEDGFAILLKADDGNPLSGRQLRLFLNQIALLRQARAAIFIARQGATGSWMPKHFNEIVALGWSGPPSHPATGELLAWKTEGATEVLVYPEQDRREDEPPPFAWRLPSRRTDRAKPSAGKHPLWPAPRGN